jgi:hypothetical protein
MAYTPQQVEEVRLFSESPAGQLLLKLGEELSWEKVAEVEVILLQQELDRQVAKAEAEGRGEEVNCRTVPEYVATFYFSGTAGIQAQLQLENLGLKILATPEGIEYLRKRFPVKGKEVEAR